MADNGQQQGQHGQRQIPLGAIPVGTRLEPIPQLHPDLLREIRKARDESGGKYMIVVFRCEDDPKSPGVNTIHFHASRGKAWSDDWFIRCYRLFVANALKFSPEMLAMFTQGVQQPAGESDPLLSGGKQPAPDSFDQPAANPDIEAVQHYAEEP